MAVRADSHTVREARDAADLDAALALRFAVFCEEQGVSREEELDGRDDEATHFVALDREGAVVGTCRLILEKGTAKLGRLAVARRARRRGVGGALVQAVEDAARRSGAARIVLGAQLEAIALYRRHGFAAYGEEFLDAGIPHRMMEKQLA